MVHKSLFLGNAPQSEWMFAHSLMKNKVKKSSWQ